jgi:hypothetical protein
MGIGYHMITRKGEGHIRNKFINKNYITYYTNDQYLNNVQNALFR